MFALFTKAFGTTTTATPKTPAARQAKPTLDTLEDRLVMSSTIINGDLYIYGNNAANTVTVRHETYGGIGYYKVTENGVNTFHRASNVYGGDVAFYGYAGNDYFNNYTGLKTFAWGMDGNDTLIGSYNSDQLDGGNGADYLYGYGGNDTLRAGYDYSYNYMDGGSGNDWLYGGWGNDSMYGQSGNDVLYGSWGNDFLSGGTGTDWLYGEAGNDTLNGGDDYTRDYLTGGAGADWYQQDFTGVNYNREWNYGFSYAAGDRFYNA